jgi:hypothetical protein
LSAIFINTAREICATIFIEKSIYFNSNPYDLKRISNFIIHQISLLPWFYRWPLVLVTVSINFFSLLLFLNFFNNLSLSKQLNLLRMLRKYKYTAYPSMIKFYESFIVFNLASNIMSHDKKL